MNAGLRVSRPSCVSPLWRTLAIAAATIATVAVLALAATPAWASFDPAAVFNLQCAGCHSVGKGEVVGPDLKGVTARRDKLWLHSFIRSSQGLVGKGEKTAVALFSRYKKKMPDHEFSDGEIDSLLAFIEAGGPRSPEGELRRASTATADEVARGRGLFTGVSTLSNGGAACVGCHTAAGVDSWRGGTLASDLSKVYLKYGDRGLTRALAESRFPMMVAAYHSRPLTPEEAFALKAFLYRTARTPQPPVEIAAGAPLLLGLGGSSLALLFTRRTLRRRSDRGGRKDRRTSAGLDG